jgi:hypothetical protein
MRPAFRLALAFTLAMATFVVPATVFPPAADAQTPPGQPLVIPPPPPGAVNYAYWDDDGWGYMTVTSAGSGSFTGVELITVRIVQNSYTHSGSGVRYGGFLFFTVDNYYFFQGPTYGWGSYHVNGNPSSQRRFWVQ